MSVFALLALFVGAVSGPRPAPIQTVALSPTAGAMATVKLAFRAGSIDDPPDRAGLTALAAELLVRGGTAAHPGESMERALYPLGARIEVQVDREQTVFTARAPREVIFEVAGWMAEEVAHPRLDAAQLAATREDAKDSLRATRDDDEALASEALVALLYPNHPYAHPPVGTAAGLDAIGSRRDELDPMRSSVAVGRPLPQTKRVRGLDEVRAQLARILTRDRLTLGLAGAYPRELAAALTEKLAALPEHGAPVAALPVPAGRTRALLAERNTDTTTIAVGLAWNVHRGDPDFVPLLVGISALGEHRQFSGRLFESLRNRRGLNYGDYAYAERFVQDGASTFPAPHVSLRQQYFSLALRPVANANRVFALRAALHVVRELVANGITEGELARTRSFLIGATRLWAQTDERQLGWAIDGAFYGDADYLAHLRASLENVTADQVNAALRRHLDPNRLRIVMVGANARELARELEANAATTRQKLPRVGLESEDAEIAREPLGLAAEDVAVVDAESLFAR